MRITTILLAVCSAFAFAHITSASAQTERNNPAGAAGGPVQGGTMAPPAKTVNPTVLKNRREPGGVPLNKEECKGLGGTLVTTTVSSDPTIGCLSGESCVRADQNGVVHSSCITQK